jgi:hypothetical protein
MAKINDAILQKRATIGAIQISKLVGEWPAYLNSSATVK